MKKKNKKPKCDCADVIGRNQVCNVCQGVEEKPVQIIDDVVRPIPWDGCVVADKEWDGYLKKASIDSSSIPDQHLKNDYYDFDRWEGEPCIKITEYPKHSWELYPFCNDKYLTILLPKAPNIFYRWMMTLFFGFRWKRIK